MEAVDNTEKTVEELAQEDNCKRRGPKLKLDGAAYARIPRPTLYYWLKKGHEDVEKGKTGTLYAKLLEDYEHADAEGSTIFFENILAAQTLDWKAAAWIFERRNEAFANRQRNELSGPGGSPIKTEGTVQVLLLPTPEDKPA